MPKAGAEHCRHSVPAVDQEYVLCSKFLQKARPIAVIPREDYRVGDGRGSHTKPLFRKYTSLAQALTDLL